MMTIGARIKEKRVQLGLSVDELAARLGKNRATVYRYESDDIENLPLAVISPLAKALNVTPAYLMGWEDLLNDRYDVYQDEPTNCDPAFYSRLATLRNRRKLSPQNIAKGIGISAEEYSRYESGTTEPSIDILKRIADYFCVTADYLIGRSEMDEFSKVFRKSLADILPTLTGFDGVPEAEADYNELCSIQSSTVPLTLVEMEDIADRIGKPLPQMLGIEGKSASTAVSSEEDALNQELISRLVQLTPAELEKVDAFVQGILASR